jgi:hypothetical protein
MERYAITGLLVLGMLLMIIGVKKRVNWKWVELYHLGLFIVWIGLLVGMKNPLISLIAAGVGLIGGIICGLILSLIYFKKEALFVLIKDLRDKLLIFASFAGFIALIGGLIFRSTYMPWEAGIALLFTLQSQLAFIYFKLGEISGKIKVAKVRAGEG